MKFMKNVPGNFGWTSLAGCPLILACTAAAAIAAQADLPMPPQQYISLQGGQALPSGELPKVTTQEEKLALAQNGLNTSVQQVQTDTPSCSILDDPQKRALMSGPFEFRLLQQCGRTSELGAVAAKVAPIGVPKAGIAGATNIAVNNPAADTVSTSHTQSETSIAVNPNTGTICAAYNDSGSLYTGGDGFSGFSRSTNGGKSFTDGGPFPSGAGGASWGDPSLVWRKADGKFYYAAMCSTGPTDGSLCLWRSDDDCATFSQISTIHIGTEDDKELMAVDNSAASPYKGRLHVVWTNFVDGIIYASHSDDTTTWSTPVAISSPTEAFFVQGAWPAVGPSGEVYVGWVNWDAYPQGPINIQIVRSTNGGTTFTPVSNPLTGGINPRDLSASIFCNRPALNGEIRYLPSPQLTVGKDGTLHVVYAAAPPITLVSENFNGTWPPADWLVTNWGGDCTWQRNDSVSRANYTGGNGYCAAADSNRCGASTTMATGLFSPVFSLAGASNPVLEFKYDYYYQAPDGFEVYLYDDNAGSYIYPALLSWSGASRRGPGIVRLDLSAFTDYTNLSVGFYYHGEYSWWAQVDDVRIVKNTTLPAADTINVYYRRSTDQGATWQPEVLLNDDGTTTDQFFPTISSDDTGKNIVATWYDRRLDPSNLQFDYYGRYSRDGGVTWKPSVRLSTSSSPIYLDPELATCYHGDYDQQVQHKGKAYVLWSDDRNIQDGHYDSDVWFNFMKVGGFPWAMFLPATNSGK